MKRFLLIFVLSACCFGADPVYINDIIQPNDAIVIHASDSAADGLDTIKKGAYIMLCKGIELIPDINDSGYLVVNPKGSAPNVWVKLFLLKGFAKGFLFDRINWTLSTIDSCYAYLRQQ
jgi:hypothetical protein